MAIVTYKDITYPCSKAIKGDNYIHLVDANGCMIAAFDGIKSFDGFTISDGEWVIPSKEEACHLAVVHEDGKVGKSGIKVCDAVTPRYRITLTTDAAGWKASGSTYSKSVTIDGIQPSDLVVMYPEEQQPWAQSYLSIDVEENRITFSTPVLPTENCTMYLYIIKALDTIVLS